MNKQYFEKLNTDKLAEFNKQNELQKVEFNVLSDVKKAISKAEKLVTKAEKLADKIEKAFKNYNDVQEQGLQLSKELVDVKSFNETRSETALDAAKELGLDGNDIPEVKKIQEMDTILQRTINLLKYPSIR